MHKSTVRKILKHYKYKCYVEGHLLQVLHPGDDVRRFQFCQWLVSRCTADPIFLKCVIWTDETNFSNNGMQKNYHYWSRTNPLRTTETHHQVRFSFNCWCAIIHNRVLAVRFYEGTLNSAKKFEIMW